MYKYQSKKRRESIRVVHGFQCEVREAVEPPAWRFLVGPASRGRMNPMNSIVHCVE